MNVSRSVDTLRTSCSSAPPGAPLSPQVPFRKRSPKMMRNRIAIGLLMVSLLVWAGVAAAQAPPGAVTSGTEGLKITGFISATAFLQNQNFTFGNGQNAEFPNPPQTT